MSLIGQEILETTLSLSLSLCSCVTSRFDTLINMCVEVLHDVMDLTEDDVIFELVQANDCQNIH